MDTLNGSSWAVHVLLMLSLLCFQFSVPAELGELREAPEVAGESDQELWNTDTFKEEADQTYNLVFHKYNHQIRPPDLFVEIDLSMTLSHIRYLDLVKQELQVVLDLGLNWVDSRLRWLPYMVKEIHQSTDLVWTPDLVYLDSVAPVQELFPSVVRIIHNGSVSWKRKEIVTVRCDTDLTAGVQTCPVQLGFITNSPDSNDQDRFFFADSSHATDHHDVETFNHQWKLSSLEMSMGDKNASKSRTLDFQLTLEKRNTGSDGKAEGSGSYTTENSLDMDGSSGKGTGNSGSGSSSSQTGSCNGVRASTHACGVYILVLYSVIGVWLVGVIKV